MTAFSIRDIEDLKPRERRYDVPIEDDFVVSVLPNGIKTWVYVYEQDGRLQRRTLGVHPDMRSEAARASLNAARQTRRALQEAMELSAQVTAGRNDGGSRRARSPRLALAGAVIVAVLVAAGGYVVLREGGQSSAGSAHEQPSVATSGSTQAASAGPGGVHSAATAGTDSDPAGRPDSPDALQAENSTSAIETRPPIVAPSAQVPVASARAPGVVAHDTRVARAVLTSDIVRREPVDTIGPEIRADAGGVQHIVFFTELRHPAGQNLRYRWLRDGHVEAEIPMTASTSWRWRSYSRKDLQPAQTGTWRVQLLSESGDILAEAQFVYRDAFSDSQSADAN